MPVGALVSPNPDLDLHLLQETFGKAIKIRRSLIQYWKAGFPIAGFDGSTDPNLLGMIEEKKCQLKDFYAALMVVRLAENTPMSPRLRDYILHLFDLAQAGHSSCN